MGQLPTLKVDDKIICQSEAILFYCGTLAGLVPKDTWGQTKVLEALGCFEDLIKLIVPSLMEQDAAKKTKLREELAKDKFPQILPRLEKFVAANGHPGYTVGSGLTVADLAAYQVIGWITSGVLDGIPKDIVSPKAYPALTKVVETVDNNPKVKEWNEKHEKVSL